MIGISKEFLESILSNSNEKYKMSDQYIEAQRKVIEALINACEELDHWMPIDKNTPKDRRLLLKANCGVAVEGSFNGRHWEEHLLHTEIRPTHYKELPEDPK